MINCYPAMDVQIVRLLRLTDEPHEQYAAARIEQLEAENERLDHRNAELVEGLKRLQYRHQSYSFSAKMKRECLGCDATVLYSLTGPEEFPVCKADCWIAALLKENS